MGKKHRNQKQRKEKKVKKAKVQQDRELEALYELIIPTYIEEPALETLAQILEEELQEDGEVYGYDENYNSLGFFKSCTIDFVARNTNKVIERISESLTDHGLPLGSELRCNDKLIKRIGRLHVIHVDLSYEIAVSPIVNEVFAKRIYSRALALLGDVQVFSSSVIDTVNHKAALYFYVIDKELALEAIKASIDDLRWFFRIIIKIADSKMTVQEHYMNQLTSPYRYFIQPIWRKMQKEWKGVKGYSLQELQKAFPQTPQRLLDMLSMVNGTWHKRFSPLQLKVPTFIVEEQELYLLSAEEMMIHSREELEILKPALEASVRPKGIRARLSQWNACLIAKSEDGESRLYIDYHPTKEGIEGQVLFYDGQSEKIQVMASSFAKFLITLIGNNRHTYSMSALQTLTELLQAYKNKELELSTDMVAVIQKGLHRMQEEAERKLQQDEDKRDMLATDPFDENNFDFSEVIETFLEKWKNKHS